MLWLPSDYRGGLLDGESRQTSVCMGPSAVIGGGNGNVMFITFQE